MEYIQQKQCIEKLPHSSFWYDETVIFLINAYIDSHQNCSCLSGIYVGVDDICSNKPWKITEERLCFEILSWSQGSGNKNKLSFSD